MNSLSEQQILNSTLAKLPFEPLPEQMEVLEGAARFLASPPGREVMVINGYAGTGKTSLVGALIRALVGMRMRVVVLAPTGRAAKVASEFSGHPASTIHRRLFRPAYTDGAGKGYVLASNQTPDTLFIVDEASLIPDSPNASGSLLNLLVRYVYSCPGCRMILVGDIAQLPPVGQESSRAMDPQRLGELGLKAYPYSLSVPVRQASDSGIVHNATLVRHFLFNVPREIPPELHVSGFPEIKVLDSYSVIDEIDSSFRSVGEDETLVITRSNIRANRFNNALRNELMDAEGPLQKGDRLIVAHNDYYWARKNGLKRNLIANGEMATVNWVGVTRKMYGRFFTEVEMELSDGSLITTQIMLRSLVSEGPSIPREELERFQARVLEAYDGVFSERMAQALEDDYFNALQVKYGWCVTCHKAQGGQWKNVFIDMGGINPEEANDDFYRWLYTALTRAREKVFLISPTVNLL